MSKSTDSILNDIRARRLLRPYIFLFCSIASDISMQYSEYAFVSKIYVFVVYTKKQVNIELQIVYVVYCTLITVFPQYSPHSKVNEAPQ